MRSERESRSYVVSIDRAREGRVGKTCFVVNSGFELDTKDRSSSLDKVFNETTLFLSPVSSYSAFMTTIFMVKRSKRYSLIAFFSLTFTLMAHLLSILDIRNPKSC